MFTGKEERVTLEFANSLAGAVIDRFGKEIAMIPADGEHFHIHTEVAVSPQFFGWLCGFVDCVKVVAPESVVLKMKEHISSIDKLYSN